jgi:hypothetical protein
MNALTLQSGPEKREAEGGVDEPEQKKQKKLYDAEAVRVSCIRTIHGVDLMPVVPYSAAGGLPVACGRLLAV